MRGRCPRPLDEPSRSTQNMIPEVGLTVNVFLKIFLLFVTGSFSAKAPEAGAAGSVPENHTAAEA